MTAPDPRIALGCEVEPSVRGPYGFVERRFRYWCLLRCVDNRALCGACYGDPNREFRREVVA